MDDSTRTVVLDALLGVREDIAAVFDESTSESMRRIGLALARVVDDRIALVAGGRDVVIEKKPSDSLVYGICACCGGLNTLSPEWCWINRPGNPADPDRENVTDTHVCDDCDDVVGIEWAYSQADGSIELGDRKFATIEEAQESIRARVRAEEVDRG